MNCKSNLTDKFLNLSGSCSYVFMSINFNDRNDSVYYPYIFAWKLNSIPYIHLIDPINIQYWHKMTYEIDLLTASQWNNFFLSFNNARRLERVRRSCSCLWNLSLAAIFGIQSYEQHCKCWNAIKETANNIGKHNIWIFKNNTKYNSCNIKNVQKYENIL